MSAASVLKARWFFAAAVLVFSAPVIAQEAVVEPTVTSVSAPDAATFTPEPAGETAPITFGMTLPSGRVSVLADRQMMIYSPSGRVVLVVKGPAAFAVRLGDTRITFHLLSGRLMATSRAPQAGQPVFVAVGPADAPIAETAVGRGTTVVSYDGTHADIAYDPQGDGEPAMNVTVRGQPQALAAGQRLTIEQTATAGPVGAWLAENGMDILDSGHRLAVGSARTARLNIQNRLFDNVINWDRLAQASAIIPTLELEQYKPEVRTVTASVQTTVQNTTNRGSSPQTPPIPGANEVPPLSPAAVSVGGVTAVTINNQNASNLLTRTQSRGLGFNGPAQLAIPGFLNGTRTFGPAGLGARP